MLKIPFDLVGKARGWKNLKENIVIICGKYGKTFPVLKSQNNYFIIIKISKYCRSHLHAFQCQSFFYSAK